MRPKLGNVILVHSNSGVHILLLTYLQALLVSSSKSATTHNGRTQSRIARQIEDAAHDDG